ncbi:MAG: hypothetical protein WBA10_04805 [Elainellaceae cyanobacterium]
MTSKPSKALALFLSLGLATTVAACGGANTADDDVIPTDAEETEVDETEASDEGGEEGG